ncbi:Beta-glucosidase 1A like protein [Verticillium longisporum]|uniref:Beta-glucosidase 1A like protein n=1 Tax=Verticillium longisporum TaxID=100787 RepID=A0A8I2ZW59_VERLO|nr:Beta-glucosidase 1A like protein [Verticillium longisporum]RBQ70388.1 hypothetical protein VDGD_02640 [Verticillium dahliae]
MFIKAQLVLATLGAAQQVYLDAEGPTPRPQCKATRTREPEYSFTPFSHTLTDTVRYATSVPPATTTETYAEPSESLTSLVTTWRRPVAITEFGFPVFAETDKVALADQLFDTPRSNYYLSYLTEVLKAIWEDGVDVAGAYAWSFADNWEFGDGASNVDIQTVNRTSQVRNYKKSFFDLVDFVKARGG